ncbi:ATP-binding protein [Streptomyces noursei]|uniref:ATP-binding protein n=1 Tax=Streptomyces noursei TaxID=1971 RepID=UPI003817C0C9
MLAVRNDKDDPRAPQPTIHDLPALARQVAGAGLEVVSTVEGEPRPVPADCGAAVYRIVREALTNVVKHAGANRAEVRLRWCDDGLDIRVDDDGRGAGKNLPSGGHGLIGLSERAAACGGTAAARRRTTWGQDDYLFDALYAGASGFLLRDVRWDDLVHAVRVVAAGDSLLAPSATRTLIDSACCASAADRRLSPGRDCPAPVV